MPKPFFCTDELCKGCKRVFSRVDTGGREKGFCFGITTPEGREEYTVPSFDRYRFCLKHLSMRKLPISNLFQLNMNEVEVQEFIKGLSQLLQVSRS